MKFGNWGIGTPSPTLLTFDREELKPSEVGQRAPLQT
jgi:hypothetical protein